MKRTSFILAALVTATSLLSPTAVRAKARQTPGPYQPAPAASYPATPQVDASKPVTELAPAKPGRIHQTPEESPVDPLGDSETPAGPTSEVKQPAKQDGVPQGEAKQEKHQIADFPGDHAEEGEARVAEEVAEEAVEKNVGEVVEKVVREEEPREFQATPLGIMGGGCSLIH